MTSTRGSASSCFLRAFFISAPALSAPSATTYRLLAMLRSPVYFDTPSRTSRNGLTRRMSSIGMQIGSHGSRFFARSLRMTPTRDNSSCPPLLREPGAEGVQDVVDRCRASILNAPRALTQPRSATEATDHVDRREHPCR